MIYQLRFAEYKNDNHQCYCQCNRYLNWSEMDSAYISAMCICLVHVLLNDIIVTAKSRQDSLNVVSYLLDSGSYDKRVPPYDTVNHTVVVGVIYNLHTIIKIDEVQETMTTAGYLRVMWKDEGLSWNPQLYNGIRHIYLSQNSIWKPDLVLANGIEKVTELGTDMGLVMVNDNGEVTWDPFEVFTTKCMIDMTYYPFDNQSCDIMFTIWSYSDEDVVIGAAWNDEISFFKEDNYGNSIWAIESNTTNFLLKDDGTFQSFQLNLRRKPGFFLVNILLPTIILSFISAMIFIIPATSGEKIGFSVTVFLSYTVFLTILSDHLPENSDRLAIVDIYIITEVFLSVFSLIVTTIQVRLSNRTGKCVHGIYKSIVHVSRCRVPSSKSSRVFEMKHLPDQATKEDDKHMEYNTSKRQENDLYSWNEVSDAMDIIFFWIFMSTNIVVTIVVFSILSSH